MEAETITKKITRPAAAAMSQDRVACKLDGDRKVVVCGAGDASIGLLEYANDAANDEVTLLSGGLLLARTGAAYNDDAELASDADGELVTAVSGDEVVADALEASTGADQYRLVLWREPAQYTKA